MHGLTVLDGAEVLFALAVGHHAQTEFTEAFCASLSMMFVEMDAHFVRSQGSVLPPYNVFNGRF